MGNVRKEAELTYLCQLMAYRRNRDPSSLLQPTDKTHVSDKFLPAMYEKIHAQNPAQSSRRARMTSPEMVSNGKGTRKKVPRENLLEPQ